MKILKLLNPMRYINGVKGTIALFLAVLMTPFLTIAMLLVEMGRYNSAVSILDETLGVSSVSVLAEYDQYLQNRWGLLAVGQENDINTLYTSNVDINKSVLGNSLTLNTLNAEGMYALSESEILYNQIMEYSKLNAPTTLGTNFLNLAEIVASFEKFKSLNNILSLITSGVDAVDSTITLVESADDLKKYANELDGLSSTYSANYTAYESAINELIDALAESRPDDENDEEGAKEYDKNIENLTENAIATKSEYVETIDLIITNLTNYKTEMKECSTAITSIQNDIASAVSSIENINAELSSKKADLDALNKEIARMEAEGFNESSTSYSNALDYRASLEAEVAELQTKKGVATATKNGLSSTTNEWKEAFNSYSDATIGSVITSFSDLKTKVNNLDISSITSSSEKITPENYKYVSVSGYITAEDIDEYLAEQEKDLASGSLSALIEGITTFFNSILKLSLFYEPELSGYIDVNYYTEAFGGMPGEESANGGVMSVVSEIGSVLTDIKDFSASLGKIKFIKALKALKSLIEDIGDLIENIVKFAVDICNNIIDLLTSYDRLYYSTYTTFNLPCRTDYKNGNLSFKTMTGYSLPSSALPKQDINSSSVSVFDDLAALIDTIKFAAAGSGDDITFSGAELEYVLYGSNSEVANQLYTFVALYLMRLLMDIPAVLDNGEVQILATASSFGYPVVMLLMILAEPLAETVLLANGGDVSFYPYTIYLTPSGLPQLIQQLVSICKLTTDQQEAVKGKLVSAFGATMDDYDYQKTLYDFEASGGGGSGSSFMNFNYREYCFFLLLLTVTKEQQMARLSNLIQMETLSYYKTKGASYTFNLKNSYTYLSVDANVSVKQILPSLADSSLFTIDRKHYRGY
jgi:uncharacterized coiled-coil DUF342 family protein